MKSLLSYEHYRALFPASKWLPLEPLHRQLEIAHDLYLHGGAVEIQWLMARYDVSRPTIYRDLIDLRHLGFSSDCCEWPESYGPRWLEAERIKHSVTMDVEVTLSRNKLYP